MWFRLQLGDWAVIRPYVPALANGMGMCAAGEGNFLFAPLTAQLVECLACRGVIGFWLWSAVGVQFVGQP